MESEKDINNIIKLLDNKIESEVSRISLHISDGQPEETVEETYHHGRCDVGSVWATGKVRNFDC